MLRISCCVTDPVSSFSAGCCVCSRSTSAASWVTSLPGWAGSTRPPWRSWRPSARSSPPLSTTPRRRQQRSARRRHPSERCRCRRACCNGSTCVRLRPLFPTPPPFPSPLLVSKSVSAPVALPRQVPRHSLTTSAPLSGCAWGAPLRVHPRLAPLRTGPCGWSRAAAARRWCVPQEAGGILCLSCPPAPRLPHGLTRPVPPLPSSLSATQRDGGAGATAGAWPRGAGPGACVFRPASRRQQARPLPLAPAPHPHRRSPASRLRAPGGGPGGGWWGGVAALPTGGHPGGAAGHHAAAGRQPQPAVVCLRRGVCLEGGLPSGRTRRGPLPVPGSVPSHSPWPVCRRRLHSACWCSWQRTTRRCWTRRWARLLLWYAAPASAGAPASKTTWTWAAAWRSLPPPCWPPIRCVPRRGGLPLSWRGVRVPALPPLTRHAPLVSGNCQGLSLLPCATLADVPPAAVAQAKQLYFEYYISEARDQNHGRKKTT